CFINDGVQTGPGIPIANIEEFAARDYKPPEPISMPEARRPAAAPGRDAPAPSRGTTPAPRNAVPATPAPTTTPTPPASTTPGAKNNTRPLLSAPPPLPAPRDTARKGEVVKDAAGTEQAPPASRIASATSSSKYGVTTAKITVRTDGSAVAKATAGN
ncbi:MAG: hypothetical protein LBS30_03820, partial [Planctomycetota bacterium]|nr:hypothetical protein [Planctomycetota bacterium]